MLRFLYAWFIREFSATQQRWEEDLERVAVSLEQSMCGLCARCATRTTRCAGRGSARRLRPASRWSSYVKRSRYEVLLVTIKVKVVKKGFVIQATPTVLGLRVT